MGDLGQARKAAEQVRYTGDTLTATSGGDRTISDRLHSLSLHEGLCITDFVAPKLESSICRVVERLNLPRDSIEAFVYPSAEIQAECGASDLTKCVVRFSSSLIELLDDDEFEFVCGHEIGHFLLGHGIINLENAGRNLEFLMQQRAQEISVDRIGMLACGSLETASRAMMKIVSGLSSEYLRFDVTAFLAQIDSIDKLGERSILQFSTHPSTLVRVRALLWFSMLYSPGKRIACFDAAELRRLDTRIKGDLDKYVDGPTRDLVRTASEELQLWLVAHKVVEDGVFSKEEQKIVEELFGAEILEKLVRFLTDIPDNEIKVKVSQRMNSAREELKVLVPIGFGEISGKIEEAVAREFQKEH